MDDLSEVRDEESMVFVLDIVKMPSTCFVVHSLLSRLLLFFFRCVPSYPGHHTPYYPPVSLLQAERHVSSVSSVKSFQPMDVGGYVFYMEGHWLWWRRRSV